MSNLTTALQDALEKKAQQPLIKFAEQWYTKAQVSKEIDHVQTILAKSGLTQGDRVLLALPNSYQFATIYFALIDYGCIVVPMNSQLSGTELENFLTRSHVKAGFLFAKQEELAKEIMTVMAEYQFTLITLAKETTYLIQATDFSLRAIANPQKTISDQAIAILLYTSGTTGQPKEVSLTHGQIFHCAQAIIASHQLTESDLAYSFLPFFHINAQVVSLWSTCLSGGRIIIQERFSSSKFWQIVNEENVTWVSAVPTIISILLQKDRPQKITDSLRFVRSASAPLSKYTAERFEKKFQLPIIESYGMTEAASQICVNPVPPEKHKLGSVGKPTGVALQIVDESDQAVQPLTQGEIVIKGGHVVTHYTKAANQNDFRNGWFHTGDIGYIDNEGFVFITGRKKELINSGGEKISPYEVEQTIEKLTAVTKVAAVGIKHPIYGETVAVYVIKNVETDLSDQEIKTEIFEFCQKNLAKYKRPTEIRLVASLPIGPTGKIQRNKLVMSSM